MSDTHNHGPSTSINPTNTVRHDSAQYRRLARWSAGLSNPAVVSFSGAVAGFASGIVTCPLDVIKTKLQAQGSFSHPSVRKGVVSGGAVYRGMIGTARTIIRQDGVKGMYRGLGPMLLGYLPTWAVYMSVYDMTKTSLARRGYDQSDQLKALSYIYASVCAGACSTLTTNPIWVIKTRLMSQISRSASDGARTPWHYNNTMDAFRKMYRAEGLAAFYSGLAPALLGLTHVAIQFPLYEYFKKRFTGLEMGEASHHEGTQVANTAGILGATIVSKCAAIFATYPHEVIRTRLQTQQRHLHPESGHENIASSHHAQGISAKRLGNTDGIAYQPRYQGVVRTCRVILAEEGWRAFYNGMGTNMIRAVPAAMTTMLTFESLRGIITKMQDEGREMIASESV
ncbi:hypothetical protein B0A48_14903 [Cryoendolithus antarcticus]|uniref:Mitochondrial nicotinamide adenine dinucleotide transporter 1 n=1 Tax=Cryoendolithus antarcticus TaxID=1507870 RepID=A0A1V8SIT3_9PEZI|nr:hypothetical protein B0A48_14903 [Cryoendolithus antarcticus]